jgi:Uma2 family endonuclease
MSLLKPKSAIYADIEALPPNVVGEILFGSLVTHPRPARRHAAAASRMGGILNPPFGVGGGDLDDWLVLDEPELHLGPHVVVPDLAGWRKAKLAGGEGAWFDEVPDWVCEILSPSTQQYDVGPKRRIYATFSVSHLWHIDPVGKSLEVFQHQQTSWLLTHTFVGYEEVSAPPFESIRFSLGLLWPFDPPPSDSNANEA